MSQSDRLPLIQEPIPRSRWLAPLSIGTGSLVTSLIPVVATFPFLPPFGLLMLLAWRLQRPEALPVWATVLLGLFDDIFSGQPIGSAMLLWSVCVVAIDVLDTRLVWRDFWQDWLLASGAVGFCLVLGRFIASPFAAHVDTALLLQIVASCAIYPVMTRICVWLDPEPQES
jgi:rod shape-determining protein MreD